MPHQADPLLITSLQNPKIKQAVKLRERHARKQTDLFLIEGYRELLRAVNGGRKIDSLFFCPELYLGSNEASLIQKIARTGTALYRCTEAVFTKLSYRDRPDGLVAIAPQSHLTLGHLEKQLENQHNPFLIVAEAIEKPGNLGTILRCADAVGLDALIVCDACTDIHNPNVVRASVGTLFTVPVIESQGTETLQWLKKNNISILAATPHAKQEFTDIDLTGPLAIAVGTEQLGLSPQWMEQADIQVRIPMYGIADSLNVAMATTILLYEALRQRKRQK
ncbi:RNA methyltransferase [Parachlamydia sp. AcF125]|uniref:TrmH family RNA methyltransferase n=1 Tax=Parachlamydia sp. AcF125 TaxID=2795736 RepID=UPI001BC9378C|nr:RNA methyltransferase [Parachlamydia sp. AcF125]MBS4167714.1 23S rRNA (uridine(2479)-2'-O)-methyltransferase [Parachlamydia sp. AcF125]